MSLKSEYIILNSDNAFTGILLSIKGYHAVFETWDNYRYKCKITNEQKCQLINKIGCKFYIYCYAKYNVTKDRYINMVIQNIYYIDTSHIISTEEYRDKFSKYFDHIGDPVAYVRRLREGWDDTE